MKAEIRTKILHPESIQVELTITMLLRNWEEVYQRIEGSSGPALSEGVASLIWEIREAVRRVRKENLSIVREPGDDA